VGSSARGASLPDAFCRRSGGEWWSSRKAEAGKVDVMMGWLMIADAAGELLEGEMNRSSAWIE